jgi:hypothetical protein
VKRKGHHPAEALTGHFVHTVEWPGFYLDGNGLYLRVDASGSKRWILRTMVPGQTPRHRSGWLLLHNLGGGSGESQGS